jgi:hypothetical protein
VFCSISHFLCVFRFLFDWRNFQSIFCQSCLHNSEIFGHRAIVHLIISKKRVKVAASRIPDAFYLIFCFVILFFLTSSPEHSFCHLFP